MQRSEKGKYTSFLLFHSQHTHNALVPSEGQSLGLWKLILFTEFLMSSMWARQVSISSLDEAAGRGQCNILSLTTLDNRGVPNPGAPRVPRALHVILSSPKQSSTEVLPKSWGTPTPLLYVLEVCTTLWRILIRQKINKEMAHFFALWRSLFCGDNY